MRKEVGIVIKSKETNSQLEPVRNSYVAIMHQPVTILAQPCSQMHVHIKAISSISTRFNSYFGWYKMCDWASKNEPSGHIKFHHSFQVCCIITNYVLKPLK